MILTTVHAMRCPTDRSNAHPQKYASDLTVTKACNCTHLLNVLRPTSYVDFLQGNDHVNASYRNTHMRLGQ
jgi:hypothetical protein